MNKCILLCGIKRDDDDYDDNDDILYNTKGAQSSTLIILTQL